MITREDCVKIGEIVKTHNLKGDVVVASDSDLLEKYADEPVFIQLDGAPVPFFIAEDGISPRNHTSYIVKFDFVDTLDQAARLVGSEVLIEKALLDEEDIISFDYNVFELNGFTVEDEISRKTGVVTDVADYAGNVVLSVLIFDKEILLPLSEVYVIEVDFENSKLLVRIPQEIAELN